MAVAARALALLPFASAAWRDLVPAVWALWTHGWLLALLLAMPPGAASFADSELRQQLLGERLVDRGRLLGGRCDLQAASAAVARSPCRRRRLPKPCCVAATNPPQGTFSWLRCWLGQLAARIASWQSWRLPQPWVA